jgi:hypothetical protein
MIRWLTLFLDRPAGLETSSSRFWSDVTGTSPSPWRSGGRFATFVPADGDAHLRVQRVDDGLGGVHLDLHVDVAGTPSNDVASRAVALGAQRVHEDDGLVLLRSPGGFAFCLVAWQGEHRVPAAAGPVPVLVDQLCLDVPARLWDAECAFWSAFTGWELLPGALPAFVRLAVPAGLGLHVLLQRREASEPGDVVSGHPDLATLDRAGAAGSHAARGAVVGTVGSVWTVLQDPAGSAYCLTDRDPATGRRTGA